LPLDIQFIFTANPEDYTNRGSIITPLKDRIESQVLTHYPESIEDAKRITRQEAKLSNDQEKIKIPELLHELLEQIAFEARDSELIDEKSGVSARLSISAFENLVSTAERRMLINGESETIVRLSDFWGIIPSITGKVELVYEGEQEGPYVVALKLMGDAIKELFLRHLPNPEKNLKKNEVDLFEDIRNWFSRGNSLEIYLDEKDETYLPKLDKVPGLKALAKKISNHPEELQSSQELILFALSEFNILTKELVDTKMSFGDMLANMLDELDN
jgi:magnesium chelatase subunit I